MIVILLGQNECLLIERMMFGERGGEMERERERARERERDRENERFTLRERHIHAPTHPYMQRQRENKRRSARHTQIFMQRQTEGIR